MVKGAVEDALQGLKNQLPSVMADRRCRSLMRAVPAVAKAVAGWRGSAHSTDASSCWLLAWVLLLLGK